MDPVSFIATMAIEAAVNYGISYLFPSEGPRLKDLTVSASSYGVTIPIIYGTARAAGNLIWSDVIKEHKKEKQTGKGGSYNNYTYSCSFAYGFCRGPVQAVVRLYADGKIIYDATGLSAGVVNTRFPNTRYLGTEDQVPDPIIAALVGEDNTPGYRGLCYVVFKDFDLTNFGNRVPTMAATITSEANDTTPFVGMTTTALVDPALADFGNVSAVAGAFVDTLRGYVFINGTDGHGTPGIYRFNESTGVADRAILLNAATTGLPPSGPPGSPTFRNSGVGQLVGVSPADGSLYIDYGGGNVLVVARLDPVSYQAVATWGFYGVFGMEPKDGGGGARREMVFANDNSSCLHIDIFGQFSLLDPGTLAFLGTLPNYGSDLSFVPIRGCCPRGPSGYAFVVQSLGTTFDITDEGGNTLFSMTPGGSVLCDWCVYDSGTPGIIFAYTTTGGKFLSKLSLDTGELAWTTQITGYPTLMSGNTYIPNNEFGWAINGATATAYLINTVDGTFIDRASSQNAAIPAFDIGLAKFQPNFDGGAGWPVDSQVGALQLFDGQRQAIVTNGLGGNVIVNAGIGGGAATTLGSIVSDLFYQAGLTAGDFDVDPLQTTIVNGYGFANNSDVKGILAELRQVYLFDVWESDFILKTRMRGGAVPDEEIDGRVLGSSSDTATDFWKQTRIQEADLPSKITLAFMDVNNDMLVSTVHYSRPQLPIPTMYSRQQAAIEANLVLDATTANKLVRTMVYTQWTERTKHETRLPWAYSYLDPSDLIQVTLEDGRTYFERIDSMEFGADMSIPTSTFGQDAGAYLTNARIVGDGGGPGVVQTITLPMPALPFIVNLPLLRDSDDRGGAASVYYAAVGDDGAYTAKFNGATLYRATNGLDYGLVMAQPTDVEWGVVRGICPTPIWGAGPLDLFTELTIIPATSTFMLESITDDELWDGANPLIVGDEVIQFANAVQNTDNSWTVSRLLRGRRGTEWAIGTHTLAEVVLAPSAATLTTQNESLDARGQNRWYKAVGNGLSISSASAREIVYMPRDLMPYAVSDIRRYPATSTTLVAGRPIGDFLAGSGADMKIDWSRRTRMGGGLMDSTGVVPLNEVSEAYEIYWLAAPFDGDLSSNSPPAAWVRFETTTSSTFTYTDAMQTTDSFVQNLDTLHLVIYQVSGAVGRGFPSPRDIEPFRNF